MNEPEEEVEVVDPVFAPWDGRRVPVKLLGGYLGAGKTTVINEMLRRTNVPIAVLVNDVGAVNVDAELIRGHDGDTLDLTGGCVCCSLKNGFLEAFDQLRSREVPPELVIVELSGIADPKPAAALSSTPGFAVDGIVVLVDLVNFLDQVNEESIVAPGVCAQVHAADLVLLTKRDLVDAQRVVDVRQRVSKMVPDVSIIEADAAHSAAGIVGLAVRRPIAELGANPTLFDQHRTSIVPLPPRIDPEELQRILDSLDADVVRAKAIAQLASGDFVLVQVVGRRRTIEPLPMAEHHPATDLVVVSIEP